MNSELQNKLYEKYPKIFIQRKLPMSQTAMCWGIETGDGWYNIIDRLCSLIQNHIDWNRKQRSRDLKFNRALKRALQGDKSALIKYHSFKGKISEYTLNKVEEDIAAASFAEVKPKYPKIEAVQVKEKFGTLRFYTNRSDEYIDGAISMAGQMSSVTCETCGKPGELQGGGWLYTACEEHIKD
jgi:hypothetical protein